MKRNVYLDHAGASLPMAPGVEEAMGKCRACPPNSRDTEEVKQEIRRRLCRMMHIPDPCSVLLTSSDVQPLSLLAGALSSPGDRILTTPGERERLLPVFAPSQVEVLPREENGLISPEGLSPLLHRAGAVLIPHADSLTGALQPLEELGRLCREAGCLFWADASQSVGRVPIDMAAQSADILTFSAHHGLLGPRGINVLAVTAPLAPVFGALSCPAPEPSALCGFLAALEYWEDHGPSLVDRQKRLGGHLWARMKEYDGEGLAVPGPGPRDRVGIVSVDFSGRDNGEAARLLEQRWGIRAAVCEGLVRFSVGPFLRFEDIDYVQGAVGSLVSE